MGASLLREPPPHGEADIHSHIHNPRRRCRCQRAFDLFAPQFAEAQVINEIDRFGCGLDGAALDRANAERHRAQNKGAERQIKAAQAEQARAFRRRMRKCLQNVARLGDNPYIRMVNFFLF